MAETDLIRDLITAKHDAVMERLGAQDKVLDSVQREVRRTNGRVTALEQRNLVADGLGTAEENHAQRKRENRRFIVTGGYVIAASLLGGICAGVGHAIGAW